MSINESWVNNLWVNISNNNNNSNNKLCYLCYSLVGWFVHLFMMLIVIYQKVSLIFFKFKFGSYVSVSEPNVTTNFSEVMVKVRGQNCRTGNLPLAIARHSSAMA